MLADRWSAADDSFEWCGCAGEEAGVRREGEAVYVEGGEHAMLTMKGHYMRSVRESPEWYIAAFKKLSLIERHTDDYEDKDESEKAPTPEIFSAAKEFLKLLRARDRERLEEPKIFVSSEGHLLFSYGNRRRSLELRFTPSLHFHFQHAEVSPSSGMRAEDAIELICKYFEV